jgi:hypothetical protein
VAARVPRAGVLVLVAVGLAQVLVTLDCFSLTVALPRMADDLGVTTTDTVLRIGALVAASAAIPAGRLWLRGRAAVEEQPEAA